ncbi:MAG: phosphoglycerate dehydrogenase [Planctomycetales bacterium 4572_13]|nr:MAG: phosphoglycerate dehydrogenase [Planctomycetales bacterium 4572_13]
MRKILLLINSMDDFEAVVNLGISEDELSKIIGDYEGLIIRSATTVTPKVLENSGKLKGIARAGVGVDNIDIPAATQKGVLVMNTPGGNTLSAAEHTMALMLALSRNVVPACNSLKEGAWDRKKYTGNQLNNKVLGVIGLGRIGMSVVKMALGFDMKVIGFDPFAVPKEAEQLGIDVTEEIERIYRESDYISLHIPRNDQTVDMISAKELKTMKSTCRIVNCARGGIINEADLYNALNAGTIAGAALDVFTEEPPKNNGFADCPTCLVTPHLGASTEEAQIEVAVEAAKILCDAIKGGPVCNALNAPASGGGVSPVVVRYAELAKRIGTVMSTLAPGHIKSINIEFRGSIAEKPVDTVATAFTIGLLQPHFDTVVNMVNAPVLAKHRGISIDQTKNDQIKDLESSFAATVKTDKVTRTIRGTVFGDSLLRIIGIDSFGIEVTPEDTMVIIFNDDKPGVIGSVGKVFGNHGINMNTMGVGHEYQGGKAILAVSLDKTPSEKAAAELAGLDFVNEIYVCKLQ